MRIILLALFLSVAIVPNVAAQTAPRQLTEAETRRLRESIASNRAQVDASQQAAVQRQRELSRRRAEEHASFEDSYDEDDVSVYQPAAPGFAEILAHGAGVFQDEMARKEAEDAARQANLARIRAEADAVARAREHSERERQREAHERQTEMAHRQRLALSSPQNSADVAARAREMKLREDAAAERQRLAAQRSTPTTAAPARVQEPGEKSAEQRRLAEAEADSDRRREAEADRLREVQQSAQDIRTGFSGRAATCIGGGKDVLYLQTSRPPRTGCNVDFEARCPGTPAGSGIRFGQRNYIGGSCMGVGDNIRIGTMECAATAVQISITQVECGNGG